MGPNDVDIHVQLKNSHQVGGENSPTTVLLACHTEVMFTRSWNAGTFDSNLN